MKASKTETIFFCLQSKKEQLKQKENNGRKEAKTNKQRKKKETLKDEHSKGNADISKLYLKAVC